MNVCIICGKKYVPLRGNQLVCSDKCRRERKRATDRVWNRVRSKTPHRKNWWLNYLEKNRDKIREKNRKAYLKNKDKISLKDKLKRKQKIDLEKRNIRHLSWKYFREKIINERKICEICGGNENLDLHHTEYQNDLECILLLCRRCHRLVHKRGLDETKRLRRKIK